MQGKHAQALAAATVGDRPVDPWILLTGGSAGIVAGFAADLWRLGVSAARSRLVRQPTSERSATPGWPSCNHCGAR